MSQDSQNRSPDDAIVQEVHAAVEKILLLDDTTAMALIRDVLGQMTAIVADIAVLAKSAETKERAREEFNDLMVEISVLSMQLKDQRHRETPLANLLAYAEKLASAGMPVNSKDD